MVSRLNSLNDEIEAMRMETQRLVEERHKSDYKRIRSEIANHKSQSEEIDVFIKNLEEYEEVVDRFHRSAIERLMDTPMARRAAGILIEKLTSLDTKKPIM